MMSKKDLKSVERPTTRSRLPFSTTHCSEPPRTAAASTFDKCRVPEFPILLVSRVSQSLNQSVFVEEAIHTNATYDDEKCLKCEKRGYDKYICTFCRIFKSVNVYFLGTNGIVIVLNEIGKLVEGKLRFARSYLNSK